LALNLPSVKNFGEIEFWFALGKIVSILGLFRSPSTILPSTPL